MGVSIDRCIRLIHFKIEWNVGGHLNHLDLIISLYQHLLWQRSGLPKVSQRHLC